MTYLAGATNICVTLHLIERENEARKFTEILLPEIWQILVGDLTTFIDSWINIFMDISSYLFD